MGQLDGLIMFKPGKSGNPNGRPKGSISIVSALKRRLEEIPQGQKKTNLELFIDQIMSTSIKKGDVTMMKDIIDRVDGKAVQPVEVDQRVEMTFKNLEGDIKNLLHDSTTTQITEASSNTLQDGGGETFNTYTESGSDIRTDNSSPETTSLVSRLYATREIIDGCTSSTDKSE